MTIKARSQIITCEGMIMTIKARSQIITFKWVRKMGDNMAFGRKCLIVGSTTYFVGDTIKDMRFYVSETEYYQINVVLLSTNVRENSARFKIVGEISSKRKDM